MKIFISSPMKNLTEEQIRKNREDAINEIKKRFGNEKFEIIDSYFKEYTLKDASINTTIYCLGRAILKASLYQVRIRMQSDIPLCSPLLFPSLLQIPPNQHRKV